MTLEYLRGQLAARGEKDLAIIIAGVRGKLGSDIPTPTPLLDRAIEKYKANPLTPELVTQTWQTLLWSRIEQSGLDIPVEAIPACDRSEDELAELARQRRFMVYIPGIDYSHLGVIFPETQSAIEYTGPVKDRHVSQGWLDVESSIQSPNMGVTKEELWKSFRSQGTVGQTLRTYIWASDFSRALTGHHFDEYEYEASASHLLGSARKGEIICVDYSRMRDRGANFHIYSLDSRHLNVGGRSEGSKKR